MGSPEIFINFFIENISSILFLIISLLISIFIAQKYFPKSRPVYQDLNINIINQPKEKIPEEIIFQYHDKIIPRLTKYYFIFWNNGNITLNGSDIQEKDPLVIEFTNTTEIINVKYLGIEKPTIDFHYNIENNKIFFGFNYLEPKEGFKLEILHTGYEESPQIQGSIKGVPKGPEYLGKINSKQENISFWLLSIFIAISIGYQLKTLFIDYENWSWDLLQWGVFITGMILLVLVIFAAVKKRQDNPPKNLTFNEIK